MKPFLGERNRKVPGHRCLCCRNPKTKQCCPARCWPKDVARGVTVTTLRSVVVAREPHTKCPIYQASSGSLALKKVLRSFSRSAKSTLRVLMASVIFFRHLSSSDSSVPSTVCLWPYCWMIWQLSRTLLKPRVAEEPFRKWPRLDSSSSFLSSLGGRKGDGSQPRSIRRGLPSYVKRGARTHSAFSIFSKVSSACSKKFRTKGFENSRSASSSSISRIWEKVGMSTLSPKSGRVESSFCHGTPELAAILEGGKRP